MPLCDDDDDDDDADDRRPARVTTFLGLDNSLGIATTPRSVDSSPSSYPLDSVPTCLKTLN
jgi:hypothetical protein